MWPEVFRSQTVRHKPGRIPVNERSARRRDRYYLTHNKHKRRNLVILARLEPAIPTVEQVQTHSLDRTSTGFSSSKLCC